MALTHRRAVILGGSIAGLFAARAAADAYDEVVIVDRDVIRDVDGIRRGCPQGKHINGLLAAGQQAMERLYPGITEEIFADGVPTGDLAGNVRWYFKGRRIVQQVAGLTCVAATRPKLEYHVRRRTLDTPNVSVQEQVDILGLVTADGHGRVTGVLLQRAGEDPFALPADLVIDATGRGSRTPAWLREWGYGEVPETSKRIGLTYVTQHYRMRKDHHGPDLSINPVANPDVPRGAIFTKTDGDRIELTTYGLLGDAPPTDQEGLYAWLATLGTRDIYHAVQDADPLDEPVAFRFPHTMRRHYEKMDRLPHGLLVTGDAMTCFNPVYAQGMSVAAMGALVIGDHLHTGADPDPVLYFRDLARRVIDQPWEMTNTVDLGFDGVEGERTPAVRAQQLFLSLVQDAATVDGAVTAAYMRTAGLVDPPTALSTPRMLARILLGAARARLLPSGGAGTTPSTPARAVAEAPTAERERAAA